MSSDSANPPSSTSTRPSIRTDEIHNLITSLERYNGNNVPKLEAYLEKQCASPNEDKNYDLQANLALLKLYQFNPSLYKKSLTVKVLTKALMVIPGADFNLYLYMLNSAIVADEDIAQMIELKQMLESAHYADFWKVYNQNDALRQKLESVAGFKSAVQRMISANIATTYQTIAVAEAKSYLDVSDTDLGLLANSEGWSIDTANGLITLPLHKENEAKTVVISEHIKFSQLGKVIAASYQN
ncbi:hypothetical protein EV182_002283 [Spiromyces aspiralis]|uniref:Uncharacterized protein n=1 Tax=Spiromyces aspiralis TaxID=68401 RepID=A0ACC1HRY0_9FUNG|nr:hypothetical protein EV182_002283 [Spiromyces aspiralis]